MRDGEERLARDVLDFWFGDGEEPHWRDAWFKRDDSFDAAIRERFGEAVEAAVAGKLGSLAETRDGALALVLMLDQFTRNIHRGTPHAFSGDAQARRVADSAIAKGFDRTLPRLKRLFFYMPFEHSEDLKDQERAVALIDSLGLPEPTDYAVRHRDVIARFGRFPHRNAILGRASTPEEEAFLKEPGSSF